MPVKERAECRELIREIKFGKASSQRRILPPNPPKEPGNLIDPKQFNDKIIQEYYRGNVLFRVDAGTNKTVTFSRFKGAKEFVDENISHLQKEYSDGENFFFKLCKDYLILFNLSHSGPIEEKRRFEIDDETESLVALFNEVLKNDKLKSFADKLSKDGLSPIELMIESYVDITKYLQGKDVNNVNRISAQQYANRCFDMVVGLSSKTSLTKDEILAKFAKYQGDIQSLDIDRLRDLVVRNVEERALIDKRGQDFDLDAMKSKVKDFVSRNDNVELKKFLISVKDDLTQKERTDLVDVVSEPISSALHVASKKHDLELASLLLKEFGVKNVNKLDSEGKSALDYARRFKLSKLLEQYYAKKSETSVASDVVAADNPYADPEGAVKEGSLDLGYHEPQASSAPSLPPRLHQELDKINKGFETELREQIQGLQEDFSRLLRMKSGRILNYKTAAERRLQQSVNEKIVDLSTKYSSYFFIDQDNLWRSLPDMIPAQYQHRDLLQKKLNMKDGASMRAEFLKDRFKFCKDHISSKEDDKEVKKYKLKLLETKYSFSLLHEAASRQDKELMQYLFRDFGREMNDLNSQGRTAWEVYEKSLKESYKAKLVSNPEFVESLKQFSQKDLNEDGKIREYNRLFASAKRAISDFDEESASQQEDIPEDVMHLISGISEDLAAYNTTKEGDLAFFKAVSREDAEVENFQPPIGKVPDKKPEDNTPIIEEFNEVLFSVSQSIDEEVQKYTKLKQLYDENFSLREDFVNQKDFNGNSFFHYLAQYDPASYQAIKELFNYSGNEKNDQDLSSDNIFEKSQARGDELMSDQHQPSERVDVAAEGPSSRVEAPQAKELLLAGPVVNSR